MFGNPPSCHVFCSSPSCLAFCGHHPSPRIAIVFSLPSSAPNFSMSHLSVFLITSTSRASFVYFTFCHNVSSTLGKSLLFVIDARAYRMHSRSVKVAQCEIPPPVPFRHKGDCGEFGWVGVFVAYFLYKINLNPRKKKAAGKKKWPKCHF